MTPLVAIACGGAVGALLRHAMVSWTLALFGKGFPYGTLLVNVTGSFFIGAVFVWIQGRGAPPEWLRAALVTGVLGGFTTFSAFSLETLNLALAGQPIKAGLNVVLSVVLCLGAAALAMKLFRSLFV